MCNMKFSTRQKCFSLVIEKMFLLQNPKGELFSLISLRYGVKKIEENSSF